MPFLFKSTKSTPSQSTLLQSLDNAVPASTLSESNTKHDDSCYFGDSTTPSLEFFYGKDIPKAAHICDNGLFSYGDQTQMHSLSILYKYPYFHPVAIIYSLLFLWFIHFRLGILSIIIIMIIQFTIGESLKVCRHCSMQSVFDKMKMSAQLIGDILLIPYQCCVYSTESPLIQFQNTWINRNILSQCKSMFSFCPTFWMRNTTLQFILAVLEEQYLSFKGFKIYRHCLQTHDGGLIALDYWTEAKDDNTDEEYASFGDIYESATYYKHDEVRYSKHYGDNTPILFIFTTYCGDSMSMPVRKIAEYFCIRGWRVISYTKRGCGSPYYEMLPLSNHIAFDLSGMSDAELAVEYVSNRYPSAPKVCVGFSLGGSQIHDFLADINLKYKHFIAGIKIDGMTSWPESIKFNERQKLISKVLGEVVHSNYVKHLNIKDECKYFDFDKIIGIKSDECQFIEMISNILCPSNGFEDYSTYLHASGPMDIERIDVPLLVFNSWNDGFQDPYDMPIGIANLNPNIFHCVTRLGAHCIRRESISFSNCWQSKVTFEFAEAVLSLYKSNKS